MQKKSGLFTIPTLLTLFRLILSPLLLPLLLVYLLPYNVFWINVALAFLFVIFSITDFFDGYLARKYNQESLIGKILDPIADKFLIYSVLISLLAAGKMYFYWVVLLIGREFFMMGLRQLALEHAFSVPVNWLGKIKTAIQMVMLTVIILNPVQHLGLSDGGLAWNSLEMLLIAITLVLSLFSAHRYNKQCIAQFETHQAPEIKDEAYGWQDPDGF